MLFDSIIMERGREKTTDFVCVCVCVCGKILYTDVGIGYLTV